MAATAATRLLVTGDAPRAADRLRRAAPAALFGLHTVRFGVYLRPGQGRRTGWFAGYVAAWPVSGTHWPRPVHPPEWWREYGGAMTGSCPARDVRGAHDLAERLLADIPERWRHTVAVAQRAERVLGTVGPRGEGEVLLAAAWLHDIGYAESLHDTGFHPLDGARHLERAGWPSRVVGLVAHHSAALYVARVRGLAAEISRFPREDSPVADALIYADQTAGPNGRVMGIEQRLSDALRRHGPGSPHAVAHPQRAPLLRAAVQRVEQRLGMLTRVSTAA